MNKTIYKQMDSRWASLYYPRKGSTVGGCGCGLVSCVHIAIEQEAKKSWTPKTLRPWMVNKGFAPYRQGTTWNGITETLKYIGHKTVVKVWDADPMSKAWTELNKGNRIGIILFNSKKGPNGTKWTASGHYIAFTDYKVKDGKHYFYLKDSGGRNHDGWYTYENSMKGCIPKLWIVERLAEKKTTTTTKPSTTTTPSTTTKPSTTAKAYSGDFPAVRGAIRLIDFAGSQKGKYATRTHGGKDGKKYSNKFTKYFAGRGGIDSKGQMPNVYGYIPGYCTLFVCYCLEHIGEKANVPFSKLTSKKAGYWWHAPSLMKYYKSQGKLVTSASKAKAGAIAFKGSKSPTHTCIFWKYEGGYVYTWDGNVGGGVTYNKRKAGVFCGFANLTYKDYFGVGAKGIDVTRWQKYLNWYFKEKNNGKDVVAEDGDFGNCTETYTIAFQKENGLTADGTVGAKTLEKAKAVKK